MFIPIGSVSVSKLTMEFQRVLGMKNGVAGLVLNFRRSNLSMVRFLRGRPRERGESLCAGISAAVLAVLVRVVLIVGVRLRSRLWDRSVNVSPGVAALLLSCILLVV
jgi:hypothetical protein